MLFGYHTFKKTMDEHLREVAILANDPQTLVFLDTNILAYLYKLHDAARREFFVWSDVVVAANRMAIPGWAASEYLSRVTSKDLDSFTPKSKEPSQAKKALNALHETASLFVDEALLRKIRYAGDRAAFLNGFRQAIDNLEQYTRAFSQQFDPGDIHQQVVDHLSSAILDSDLAVLCARALQEGNGRFEHRLPPGFQDGKKDENRFGDLIIWFEILEKSSASRATFSKVLFITNDEKSDWVYAPKMRTEIVAGIPKFVGNSNPEIKLADPRLVSEFQRKTLHENFVICSLATLVEGLSKVSATQFAQLAAAIQINTLEATPSENLMTSEINAFQDRLVTTIDVSANEDIITLSTEKTDDRPTDIPPVQAIEPAESDLHYDHEALRDREYQADAPSEINTVIRALKSLNWYTQNPAIVSIRTIRNEDFSPSSWFVLGRNIFQAACGNSQKAMEFIAALESQLAQFPQQTAQHLLAGIVFEIYFDSSGKFRKRLKFDYADKPLALVAKPSYLNVRTFIQFFLHNYLKHLKFLPGDHKRMTVCIVLAAIPQINGNAPDEMVSELQSVTLDDVELMLDVPNRAEDPLKRMWGWEKLDQDVIRAKISSDLAIPRWAIFIKVVPPELSDKQFVIPKGRGMYPGLALDAEDQVAQIRILANMPARSGLS